MMAQTTEDRQQIDGQIAPGNVAVAPHSYKRWLATGIALIVVASLLISGIWSRVGARNALNTETAQAALTAVSVVSPKRTAPPMKSFFRGTCNPTSAHPSMPAQTVI